MKRALIAAALVAIFATQAQAYSSGLNWGFTISGGAPAPPPRVYVREYHPPPPPPVYVYRPAPPPVYVYQYVPYDRHGYKHAHKHWRKRGGCPPGHWRDD